MIWLIVTFWVIIVLPQIVLTLTIFVIYTTLDGVSFVVSIRNIMFLVKGETCCLFQQQTTLTAKNQPLYLAFPQLFIFTINLLRNWIFFIHPVLLKLLVSSPSCDKFIFILHTVLVPKYHITTSKLLQANYSSSIRL